MTAAGNPHITEDLLKGVDIGGTTYKNHLDGYDHTAQITGTGPSARHDLLYFGEAQLGAIRLDDFKYIFYQQPSGWTGPKVTTDMPEMINIRQDPFERTPMISAQTPLNGAFGYGNDFFAREFWRFVSVQDTVEKLAKTAVDYPPMQDPASFNLSALKAQIAAAQQRMKAGHVGTDAAESVMGAVQRAALQPRQGGLP